MISTHSIRSMRAPVTALLLPVWLFSAVLTSAQAGITVSVVAGKDAASSSIRAAGSVQHVITDNERRSFGIEDHALKAAVDRYFGKGPNDAYVKSPTPWGDLYKTYGWPQVQTVVEATNAQILKISSRPEIVTTQEFRNNSSVPATFNCGISVQKQNTSESNWSSTDTVEVQQKIEYGISFVAVLKGETSLTYSHSWGQGGSESESVTVGSDSGVSVELQPGESVKATLTASRGELRARVFYRAYLNGSVAVNYNPTYKDHHFWGLGIDAIMGSAGIPNTRQYTEDITVGFYSDALIEVINTKTNQTMMTKAIPAVHHQ